MKMNMHNNSFTDRLLAMEKTSPIYKEQYERKVKAMLEKKLSRIQRVGFALLAVIGICATILFCNMVQKKQEDIWRLFTVPPLVLAFIWTLLTGWITVTGKLKLRSQRLGIIIIALALCFFTVVAFMLIWIIPLSRRDISDLPILGTQLTLVGFFLVNTIGLCVVLAGLNRLDFRSREKLLEIECRLIDLTEKINNTSKKQ
jgi:Na+/proline symporter